MARSSHAVPFVGGRPRWLGLVLAVGLSIAGHLAFLAAAYAWPRPREGL